MSADMHRGQRASLGNQTDHAIKAGYKGAADFFATQHDFFLLPGRHPYKASMSIQTMQVVEGTLVYGDKCYGDWDACYVAKEFCLPP